MGWSNLPFRDCLHDGVGVEFKLLSKADPSGCMGKSLMHPAATRTIDFDENESAEGAMAKVFQNRALQSPNSRTAFVPHRRTVAPTSGEASCFGRQITASFCISRSGLRNSAPKTIRPAGTMEIIAANRRGIFISSRKRLARNGSHARCHARA